MLDPDYLNRAAPPGSMRYFALLYAPEDQKELLSALFVIESEIRASTHAAHEVAHTRLQWWRAEVDRLVNRNAQHPVTQVLQRLNASADYSRLHEVLVAADMDLLRMTYNARKELNHYLERSGATLQFAHGNVEALRRAGAFIRHVEMIRDVAADARAGHIYWPLDEIEATTNVETFRQGKDSAAMRNLVQLEVEKTLTEYRALTSLPRPIHVLVALHERLLQRIAKSKFDVFSQRHELGPLDKVWTAWRAARRS